MPLTMERVRRVKRNRVCCRQRRGHAADNRRLGAERKAMLWYSAELLRYFIHKITIFPM